jgi:diguanylate cyclase (GGDEF)-like protein
VAATLALGTGRSRDLVARYGGEEFVVLLPDTTVLGAREVAEKMRRGVEALELGSEPAQRRVTVSIGIAYAPDARLVRDEELFESADRALYQAKDFGRNRVVLGNLVQSQAPDKVAPLPFPSGRTWKSTASSPEVQ